MKFFEAVPDELFSPLASPNRALYADALDVLYTAYREKLKLPEDMLYSMLRSRLEQQLAEATFEGEDIDEDELRDISGRARFLIRKLGSKGWFEKERGTDFREYITVPGCSSRRAVLANLDRSSVFHGGFRAGDYFNGHSDLTGGAWLHLVQRPGHYTRFFV